MATRRIVVGRSGVELERVPPPKKTQSLFEKGIATLQPGRSAKRTRTDVSYYDVQDACAVIQKCTKKTEVDLDQFIEDYYNISKCLLENGHRVELLHDLLSAIHARQMC